MTTRILAIDDIPFNLLFIQNVLEAMGYEVITASNGYDGWQQFQEKQPDLVILDIVMPGMNGWEVYHCIRRISQTPVIMLTGLRSKEDVSRALKAGAADCLIKPFAPHELQDRVQAVLAGPLSSKTAVRGDISPATPPGATVNETELTKVR